MKPVDEIDPELHGLLDEVVSDPRSALRLTPRKTLARWFDTGERVRAPVDATSAEKHLLEVHREALAELLIQASRIAYWRAPDMGIVPRRSDGSAPFKGLEPERLGPAIQTHLRAYPKLACPELAALTTRLPERGAALPLAMAALALVPGDDARHAVAVATPWDEPATALVILDRLEGRVRDPERRACVASARGARLCSLGRLPEALDGYVRCRDLSEIAAIVEYYILNLSCYLDDAACAASASKRMRAASWLDSYAGAQLPILRAFAGSMDSGRVRKAHRLALSHAEGSIAASAIKEAME